MEVFCPGMLQANAQIMKHIRSAPAYDCNTVPTSDGHQPELAFQSHRILLLPLLGFISIQPGNMSVAQQRSAEVIASMC